MVTIFLNLYFLEALTAATQFNALEGPTQIPSF